MTENWKPYMLTWIPILQAGIETNIDDDPPIRILLPIKAEPSALGFYAVESFLNG